MQLTPYLIYNGRCEEAFKFYQKCLGGEIPMMMKFGESPMKDRSPPGWQDKIMHTRLIVGATTLMGSDGPDNDGEPKGFSVSIGVGDPAEAERVFNALSEGGTVRMPIQETFWAARFGMLTDKFGVPWMVNCEKPA